MIVNVAEGVPAEVEPFGRRGRCHIHLLVSHKKHLAIKWVEVVIGALSENLVGILSFRIILVHLEVALSNVRLERVDRRCVIRLVLV